MNKIKLIRNAMVLSLILCLLSCVSISMLWSGNTGPLDPDVSIKTVQQDEFNIGMKLYTKDYLNSLQTEQLVLVDSLLSKPVSFAAEARIFSDEVYQACKDIRTDKVTAFAITNDDTIDITFTAEKFYKNAQSSWAADDNTNHLGVFSGAGPACRFKKTIKLHFQELPIDTFYIKLVTEVPTAGRPDAYTYLWRIGVPGITQ